MTKETKIMTVREAIKEAMTHEMREDENVFLMGEDVGIFGGDFGTTVGMLEEFGSERVIDTPISEAAICGAAAGAASVGMRPIVDVTFMDFVTIGMDAIVNQAAPMRYMLGGDVQVPVTYRCASGAGTGAAAQHCKALEAWFCHIPGLKVVAPGTAGDVYSILRAAIRDNNPVIYIEPKALFGRKGEVEVGKIGVIGKGDIKVEGTDVTLVSWGRMLERSLKAAEELKDIAKVDIQKYGLDMLKAGASTTDKSVEFLLNMDAKSFTMGDYVTRIAQVNAVDLDEVLNRKEDLEKEMLAVSAQEKYDLFVLVVTDIINSDSKILVVGAEKDKVGEAFNVQLEDDMAFLSGVVSRKKQIVPQITEALTK